jgi:hypothetical protein
VSETPNSIAIEEDSLLRLAGLMLVVFIFLMIITRGEDSQCGYYDDDTWR